MSDGLPMPVEAVTGLRPFRVRRQARWSECDPAGVVFAGRYPDYMLAAAHLFRTHVIRASLALSPEARGYGTPAKALEMVFLSSLWPEDAFDMTVHMGSIGRRTTHLLVEARRVDDGRPVFVGRVSSIYVAPEDRTDAIGVPDHVRAQLEAYRSDCGPLPEILQQVYR